MEYCCSPIMLPNVGTIPGVENSTVRPSVRCADGTTLSVQASDFHYCSPQNNDGPYTSVEVWCVYATCAPYADFFYDEGDQDGPWGYVSVEKVAEFIAAHGGIA